MVAEKSYARALNEALAEEMRRDRSVYCLGEDVGQAGGVFSVTRGLQEEFGPRRVRDTPISEAAIAGLAVGAATLGLRPVVEIMFADFFGLCMDQVVNQAAKMRYMFGGQICLPVVFRSQGGGGVSAGPQHSQSLEAWFLHVPGLKVVMPSDPADAKGLLKSAIRDDNPVVFIEHKALYRTRGEVPDDERLVPIGEAAVRRAGNDATLIALSALVQPALEAAEELAGRGYSVEVIDLRSVSPLDWTCLAASIRKTGRVVVAHEAVKTGGIGAEVAARISEELFDSLDAPVARVGAAFTPIPFNPELERAVLPGRADLVRALERVLG